MLFLLYPDTLRMARNLLSKQASTFTFGKRFIRLRLRKVKAFKSNTFLWPCKGDFAAAVLIERALVILRQSHNTRRKKSFSVFTREGREKWACQINPRIYCVLQSALKRPPKKNFFFLLLLHPLLPYIFIARATKRSVFSRECFVLCSIF